MSPPPYPPLKGEGFCWWVGEMVAKPVIGQQGICLHTLAPSTPRRINAS
jgi:hypothetical protein